jgi:threonine dehydrogenase-like Zn-dependent dehydrogenase
MRSHALWHRSASESEIITGDIRKEEGKELLVESFFSLVSIGTERTVALGMVPPEIREQMKVPYMEGSFSFPCKYGYSLVGKIIRGPAGLKNRFVHLMHPHQDMAWVHPSSVFPLPDGIPPRRAVLAGNMETAVNALWDSEISVGDSVLIAGFGIVGALIALLASCIPGVAIVVLETNEKRRSLAAKLGFDLFENFRTGNTPFDAALNTTGDENALQICIDNTGFESQVTEVSFYGTKAVSVRMGGNFHISRKRIAVSQVSNLPLKKLARWDHLRRKQLVYNLLKDNRFDCLVENAVPFHDAPVLFKLIRSNAMHEISVLLTYQ